MEFDYCEAKVLTKNLVVDNVTECVVKVLDETKVYSSYLAIKCNMGIARILKAGPFIEGVGLDSKFKLECYSTKPDYCQNEISKFLDTVYNTKQFPVEEAKALSWDQLREEIPSYINVEEIIDSSF